MTGPQSLVLLLVFELRRALKSLALAVGVGLVVLALSCAGLQLIANVTDPPGRMWVVVGDPVLRAELRAARLLERGRIVDALPKAHRGDVVIVVPVDPARGRWEIRADDRESAQAIQPAVALAQAWTRQRAAIPPEEADVLRDIPRAEAAGLEFAEELESRELALGVSALLWVFGGTCAALLGAKEVTQRDDGLTGLLRMGIPAWTIWAARLITSSVLVWLWFVPALGIGLTFWPTQTLGVFVWGVALAAFGAGLGAAVGALEVDVGVPDLRFLGPAGLVFVALALVVVPTELRWLWAWMPGIGLIAVPTVGQAGPALLALHVVWGALAVQFGARMYASVEPWRAVSARVRR